MSTFIAALALLVSFGILAIQYRNQQDRRHGEIVQLKAQITAFFITTESAFDADEWGDTPN
jgi:hypothetical protein